MDALPSPSSHLDNAAADVDAAIAALAVGLDAVRLLVNTSTDDVAAHDALRSLNVAAGRLDYARRAIDAEQHRGGLTDA